MTELIDDIRDQAYKDKLTPWLALAFHRRAIVTGDEAARLYLEELVFGLLWQPFDQARLASELWCASAELIAQTTRCRVRRMTPEICDLAARLVAECVAADDGCDKLSLTIQEGVDRTAYYRASPQPAKSDRLHCEIIRVGALWHFKASAERVVCPTTHRWHPISLVARGPYTTRFAGAWNYEGVPAMEVL